MAAIDTFEWFAAKFYPAPSDKIRKFLETERLHLLSLRNENERLRYIESLMHNVRVEKKASAGS